MAIRIDADFPGGNIIVEEVQDGVVRLHQDLGETPQAWFYWNFKIFGAEGQTIRFEFTESIAIGAHGPVLSADRGASWRYLGRENASNNHFEYSFSDNETEVHFSMAIPYVLNDWNVFYNSFSHKKSLKETVLNTTRHGRENKYYTVDAEDTAKHSLLLTARHHCCEMMVNFVIEGFLSYMFESDESEAKYLRKHLDMFLVPFVDLDGSEEGDQGKARAPRDHGRDYVGESIHPDCAAIREKAPAWRAFDYCIDLHCPWISGNWNQRIYQVGSDNDLFAAEQKLLTDQMVSANRGELKIRQDDYLPYGEAWNTSKNRTPGSGGIHRWDGTLPHVILGTTFEFPYADIHGVQVTRENARAFGQDFGRGLSRYFQSK